MASIFTAPAPRLPRADVLALLRRTVVVTTSVALLAFTMNWISAELVAPIFGYLGYTYVPAPSSVLAVLIGMTTIVAFALPRRIVLPSHVVLWTLFVVCVAPTMLMSASTGYVSTSTAVLLAGAVGSAFALVALGTPRQQKVRATADSTSDVLRLGNLTMTRSALTWTFCSVYSLLTYGIMTATVGLKLQFVALDDIYDVRADYTADVGTGGALGYLLTGQAYVVNPLILARGLFRRRPSLIVLALVGQFLLYSSTGFKAVLFSFVAVLGMAVLFRGKSGRSSTPFLVAPLAIMVVSAAADELQGGITWTSVFTRRFMLTPGLLSSVYVDYFSNNPVAMYAYSFLGTWFDYPYDLPPPKRIADYLVPGSTGYANANLFADGFANFGWFGIGVAALALWLWLRCVDVATRGLPLRVAAMALVMPSIMLSNTSIFTAMLSHGLLMGTLVLLICPRTGWEPRSARATRTTRTASSFGAAGEPRVGAELTLSSTPRATSRAAAIAERTGRRPGTASMARGEGPSVRSAGRRAGRRAHVRRSAPARP